MLQTCMLETGEDEKVALIFFRNNKLILNKTVARSNVK